MSRRISISDYLHFVDSIQNPRLLLFGSGVYGIPTPGRSKAGVRLDAFGAGRDRSSGLTHTRAKGVSCHGELPSAGIVNDRHSGAMSFKKTPI